MELRKLGNSGPIVSRLSLGSWNTYERMDFGDAVELLARALGAGVNLFDVSRYSWDEDSAAPKGSPHTESIFSRVIEATGVARHRYALSVKMWYDLDQITIAQQLDQSLLRLGTEYADIVCTSSPRTHGLSTGELVDQLAALIADGRARSWGAGNWSAALLREVCEYATDHGLPVPVFVQQKYNVARRSVVENDEYVAVSNEFGVAVHAADVLEGGTLVGRVPERRKLGRDPGGIRERIIGYADDFRAAAERIGATPAQLALAFALRNDLVASAVVGVSRLTQLEDNLGAFALLERLGDDIEAVVEPFRIGEHVLDPY